MYIFLSVFYVGFDIIKLIFMAIAEVFCGMRRGYGWKKWAYRYVPCHVNDNTLLAIMSLLSIKGLSKSRSMENYDKNIVGWEQYLDCHKNELYIECQEDMTDILFYGKHSADYNACEIIAIYNTELYLENENIKTTFPMLLHLFEKSGICANGIFGTSPRAIYKYFKKSKYDAYMLSGKAVTKKALYDMEKKYKAFILTAYNNKNDVSDEIHTVAITGKDKLVIHNASKGNVFSSLYDAVSGYNNGNGKPICIIGLR